MKLNGIAVKASDIKGPDAACQAYDRFEVPCDCGAWHHYVRDEQADQETAKASRTWRPRVRRRQLAQA